MNKEEFRLLFDRELEVAVANAERKLDHAVPCNFEIEMQGLTDRHSFMTKDEAVEMLYLGPDRFYRIVDLAVVGVSKDVCRVYVRISGHKPGQLSETWNQPAGSGPFKQLIPDEIREF